MGILNNLVFLVCKYIIHVYPTISKGPSINDVRTWGRGVSLLLISIAYYMQKLGEGVQIACTNA